MSGNADLVRVSSHPQRMTVGDLRAALEGLPDDMPVIYDDGEESWPMDESGVFPDGFTLFANEAPTAHYLRCEIAMLQDKLEAARGSDTGRSEE